MRRLSFLTLPTLALLLTAFRCPGTDPHGGPALNPGTGGAGAAPETGGWGGGGFEECPGTEVDVDDDGDGYTEENGDCNDCDPDIHPGAAELVDIPGDENCDGSDELVTCEPPDVGLTTLAELAARVMDVCNPPLPAQWGLQEASFTRLDGDPYVAGGAKQIASAKSFGNALVPKVGQRMLVLSTGVALDADAPNACPNTGCGNSNSGKMPPAGVLVGPPGCPEPEFIYDDVALEVQVRPPPAATGFRFHTTFLTHEYPASVCSPFRDLFVALLAPVPNNGESTNVVFDGMGIPPSVDFTPFPHCDPNTADAWAGWCMQTAACPPRPDPYCPQGIALLEGTGFSPADHPNQNAGGGATGWLETTVPLTEGHNIIEIRFAIADTDGFTRDSTVLIDGFAWLGGTDFGEAPTTVVE